MERAFTFFSRPRGYGFTVFLGTGVFVVGLGFFVIGYAIGGIAYVKEYGASAKMLLGFYDSLSGTGAVLFVAISLYAFTVIGAGINAISYALVEGFLYRMIWGPVDLDLLDKAMRFNGVALIFRLALCFGGLYWAKQHDNLTGLFVSIFGFIPIVRGMLDSILKRNRIYIGPAPIDPELMKMSLKCAGLTPQTSASAVVQIIRAKIGSDFGKVPRVDVLTANGDVARNISFSFFFFALLSSSLTSNDETFFLVRLALWLLAFAAFFSFVHFQQSLIKLYLRLCIYLLNPDLSEPGRKFPSPSENDADSG